MSLLGAGELSAVTTAALRGVGQIRAGGDYRIARLTDGSGWSRDQQNSRGEHNEGWDLRVHE